MYHQGDPSSTNHSFTYGNSGPGFVDVTADPRSHSAWVPGQGLTWQFPTAKMQSDREAAERSWILFYDNKLREERERLAVAAALQLHWSRQQQSFAEQQQQMTGGYQPVVPSHHSSPFPLQPVSPNRQQQPKPFNHHQQSTATYYQDDPRVLAASRRSSVIYQQVISSAKSSVPSNQNHPPSALEESFVPRKRCICKDFVQTGKCEATEQQKLVIYEPQIAEGHWQYHWGTFTSSSSSSLEPYSSRN